MNVIGIIGQWIIDYQEIIEIILLSVLGLIILIAVISAFARAQKRRSMLEDISNRVGNIQETVTSIQEEQRHQHPEGFPVAVPAPVAVPCPPAPAAPAGPVGPEEMAASPAAMAATAAQAAGEVQPSPVEAASPAVQAAGEAPVMPVAPAAQQAAPGTMAISAEPEPALGQTKYVTRDWGIDKFGRSYTEEELTQQIR